MHKFLVGGWLCVLVSWAPLAHARSSTKRSRPRPGDLLRLVNKRPKTALPRNYRPTDLAKVNKKWCAPGRRVLLRQEARRAFEKMASQARADAGIEFRVRSGFRSFSRQKATFASKVRRDGARKARRLSAVAGHSQHQLGTTVDITLRRFRWQLTPRMGRGKEGKWLRNNAHRFGFVLSYPKGKEAITGYAYEAWHYRFIGVAAAKELADHKLVLETYLARCQRGDPKLSCPQQ